MKLNQTVDSNYKKTSDGDNSTNKNYRRRCFNQFAFQSLRPGYHRSIDRSVEALFYTWWVLTRINFFPLRLCFQPFNSRDLNHSVPIRLRLTFFVTSLSLSILYVLKDRYDIAKDIVQCIRIELYRKVRCLYF